MRLPSLALAVALSACSSKGESSGRATADVRVTSPPDPSNSAAPSVPGADDLIGMLVRFADATCECTDTACASDVHATYIAYASRAPAPKSDGERAGVSREAKRLQECVDRLYAPMMAELTGVASAACACADPDCASAAQARFGNRIKAEPRPPERVRAQVAALAEPMVACGTKLLSAAD